MNIIPSVFAQEELGPISGPGLGPFGENIAGSGGTGLQQITNIVSSVIGIMTIGAGIWFIFQFLVGGINWISAGGDKTKLQSARDRLSNAFLGLVVVVAGWGILALSGRFFNFDILLSNPESIIQNL